KCIGTDGGQQVAFDDSKGLVHLWNLADRREVAVRLAPGVREMIFTAHGVALVRPTVIQVFGGTDGDFVVEIPRGSGTPARGRPGGVAGSRGGRPVAVGPGR